MPKREYLIIIPAYNEEKNVGKVLRELRNQNLDADILVVNDGSRDNTAIEVEQAGERVISLFCNLGYAGALQTGFKYARFMGYDYVIQFDADGQHDPADIPIILEELRSGRYDIVIGSRFLGESFNIGFLKKSAISVFRFIIRMSTGVRITDPTSGLQGLNRCAYRFYAEEGNYPEDYPDADTLIGSILEGFRIKEIPAYIRERQAGSSMHSGLKTVYYMVKMFVAISVVLLRKRFVTEGVNHGQ